MYLNKNIVLSAFRELGNLTDKTGKRPIEITSALRYLIASSALIKNRNNGPQVNLSKNDTKNRIDFISEVGKVVEIQNTTYTNNFYNDFQKSDDYAARNNFLTTRLRNNGGYPGRPAPLVEINNENISIIDNLSSTINDYYFNRPEIKTALVLWLIRNTKVEAFDNIESFIDQCNSFISEKYEEKLASVLFLNLSCVEEFLKKYDIASSNLLTDILYDYDDFVSTIESEYPKIRKEAEHEADKAFQGPLNIVYYGPPGTGKTRKIFYDHIVDKNNESKSFITFHQAYSYEEFIEGIKPHIDSDNIRYEYSDGIFYKACNKAAALAGYENLEEALNDSVEEREKKFSIAIRDGKLFSFCIDEINRANIASVFGDLITLIEIDKRLGSEEELIVILPYSKRLFGVPLNMQIVGTMNSADRSISLIDTALRRRFSFVEIGPNPHLLNNDVEGVDLESLLLKINQRIKYFLGKDQCIGHSYFMKVKSKKELLQAFISKIIPLLEEYFYNDMKKISLVLGDTNKKDNNLCFYINEEKSKIPDLFRGIDDDEVDGKEVLILNPVLFQLLEKEDTIPAELFINMYE